MKTPSVFLCAAVLMSALSPWLQAAPASPSPFTMNGWQFHDYSMPKLEEAVQQAPGYGVNFFIFSHEWFRSVEGFLASTDDLDLKHPPAHLDEIQKGEYFRLIPGWQSDLRHIGDLATAKGIPYYLWVHEFDDVPKRFLKNGRVDMDDPGLFPYLTERYEKLLQAVPGTAGFVVTLHESDYHVFNNDMVSSKDPVPERIYRIMTFFHELLQRHHKQLILRNFFYEPWEMECFNQALARMPDDVIAMCKDTTHEFDPFYPWDPQHGNVGKKRQIIEVDLGVEKAWSSQGAYAQTDYLHRLALHAREKGLTGMVGRARLHWDHPFEDMHEVNFYAFSRFMADPDLSVDTVLHDWSAKRYPAGAVPYIVSALKHSEFINHHGRWPLAEWMTKSIGEEWGDYPYYYGHVLERARSKWTHDPADKELEDKFYHPDMEFFHRIVAEKDEVVAQVRAAQNDLRQASRYATAEQLAALREDFRFLLDASLLQREWIRAYFAQRMFIDHPSEEYRMVMEDALTKLEQYEHTPGVTYGLNVETGRRYNIDAFELEMRWRVANRARAKADDARILEEVHKRTDGASHGDAVPFTFPS